MTAPSNGKELLKLMRDLLESTKDLEQKFNTTIEYLKIVLEDRIKFFEGWTANDPD